MGSNYYHDFVPAPAATVLQDDTPVIGSDVPRNNQNDDKNRTSRREGLCNGHWLATRSRTPLNLSCQSWDSRRPRYKISTTRKEAYRTAPGAIDAMRANPTSVQPWISTMQ